MSGSAVTPRQANFWQRLSPFLDVLGAVLIFGSWIFSHSLSQRAADRLNTHQSIITRVREYRLYDGFARRLTDIQSDLLRTKMLVETAARNASVTDGQATSQPEPLTWTGMSVNQVREMRDYVQDILRYAGQLETSGSVTELIQQAQASAAELSQAFDSARADYDRLTELTRNAALSDESDSDLAQQKEALRVEVDQLWDHYVNDARTFLNVGDKLLRVAEAESQSASHLANICTRLSYLLYIVGTLIVLYGRAKNAFGSS